MYESWNLKLVSKNPQVAVGSVTDFDGLAYMYVKVAKTNRALGGDALTIDADYSAILTGPSTKIDGVVPWDVDIDAWAQDMYAWVIIPGGYSPKNFLINWGTATHSGSVPNLSGDMSNSALAQGPASAASALAFGKVYGTGFPAAVTGSADTTISAGLNSVISMLTNVAVAGLRGVSAVSAHTATGSPASAGMFTPQESLHHHRNRCEWR